MRIRTVQLPLAKTAEDLFDHTDPEVVLSLLTHKLIRASLEEGLKEARMQVQVRPKTGMTAQIIVCLTEHDFQWFWTLRITFWVVVLDAIQTGRAVSGCLFTWSETALSEIRE